MCWNWTVLSKLECVVGPKIAYYPDSDIDEIKL